MSLKTTKEELLDFEFGLDSVEIGDRESMFGVSIFRASENRFSINSMIPVTRPTAARQINNIGRKKSAS